MHSIKDITDYKTESKYNHKDFVIPVSIHAPPMQGWHRTNSLDHAKIENLNMSELVKQHKVITDLREEKKGSKIIELGKKHVRLFAPVTWKKMEGNRNLDNVKLVHAAVLDFDGIDSVVTLKILTKLSDMCYVAYSSFSNGSHNKGGKDACRIILPFDQPVNPQQFMVIWQRLQQLFPENDISTKDSSRLWYFPSVRQDRQLNRWFKANSGYKLDTTKMLRTDRTPRNKAETTEENLVVVDVDCDAGTVSRKEKYSLGLLPHTYQVKGHDGETRPLSWYIANWVNLDKRNGRYQCYARGSETLGSAFMSRRVNVYGLPRYRLTECNSNKTNYDCIHTDDGLELSYRARQTQWAPLACVDNLMIIIRLMGIDLWKCEIRQQLFVGKEPLTDSKELAIMNQIRTKYFTGRTIAFQMVQQAILLYGEGNSRNTLQEWLYGLVWDGTSRLDRLFIDWLGAPDNAINRVYGRKWAVSTVARCLKPGCKVDTMVVLKAPQGHGKGTFFRTLASQCPITGYSWYNSSKINIGEKDGRSILRTAWIHEMAELAVMAKKDANVIKNFLDEQFDTFRKVYTKHEVKEPRTCVFVGSTNDDDVGIFKDKTGSRRYWFIELEGEEHTMAYNPKDLADEVDQIWAEAVHLFLDHKEWWLTKDEQVMSAQENERHALIGLHESVVSEYLSRHAGDYFTISDMIEEVYKDKSIKPMIYDNYYPTLLARLGAEIQNGGRRCRRGKTNQNRTGWYKAPTLDSGLWD